MDKKKDCKLAECGGLPDLTGKRVVVGTKQLKKAVICGRAGRVFLAENADPALLEPLVALCEEHHIRITWVATMSRLGQACGIEVGAAAAAVVN